MNAGMWTRNTVGALMATALTQYGSMAHAGQPAQQAQEPPTSTRDIAELGLPARSSAQPPVVRVAARPQQAAAAVEPAMRQSDDPFEKRAASFANFVRNQAASGFDVSLRLTPEQVSAMSDRQREILSQYGIRVDVAEAHFARPREGASHWERETTLESNDRLMLTPNAYFANNYVTRPSTVLHMEG